MFSAITCRGNGVRRMKILIIDDHPLFLAGLRRVLEDSAAACDVVDADSRASALARLDADPDVDVVCLDLQFPGDDGYALLRALDERYPGIPVVIVSALEDAALVQRALEAGAAGYVSKACGKTELLRAVDGAARGRRYVATRLRAGLERYLDAHGMGRTDPFRLTRRQREVLALLVDGLGNGAIAERLALAESTVKGHVSTLFATLGVDNRAGCAREAIRLGLVRRLDQPGHGLE